MHHSQSNEHAYALCASTNAFVTYHDHSGDPGDIKIKFNFNVRQVAKSNLATLSFLIITIITFNDSTQPNSVDYYY